MDERGNPDFAAIRRDPAFQSVRNRLSGFIFPMTGLFLFWYMTFVLLAAYAPGFMAHRVSGSVAIGLLLGLSQFVSTVIIMVLYLRFVRRTIDPQINALRDRAGAPRS